MNFIGWNPHDEEKDFEDYSELCQGNILEWSDVEPQLIREAQNPFVTPITDAVGTLQHTASGLHHRDLVARRSRTRTRSVQEIARQCGKGLSLLGKRIIPMTIWIRQYAMNKWAENEISFACEYQNEPMKPDQGAMLVPVKVIRTRVNGLDHQTLPLEAQALTSVINVHDDLLYYTVCAWSDDFTGFVIDYGTYPKQVRRHFTKGEAGLAVMFQNDQRKDGVI